MIQITEELLTKVHPRLAKYYKRMKERLYNDSENCIMHHFAFYADEHGVTVENMHPEYQNSQISVMGSHVYATSGWRASDKHLNEFLNNSVMMPNMIYHIDSVYTYYTDCFGRVVKVREDYTSSDIEDRIADRSSHRNIAVSKGGLTGDIGCHIVANNRAGMAEAINIVPLEQSFRLGRFRSSEIAIYLAKEKQVHDRTSLKTVTTRLKYKGDSLRPVSIAISMESFDGNMSAKFYCP